MIIPYAVDVAMERWPIANWVLIAVTVGVSFLGFSDMEEGAYFSQWIFFGSGVFRTDVGLIGSILTHGDIYHLIGNMLFLFLFGNAINAKLGHTLFIACYFAFGIISGLVSSLTSEIPGLGASGAIAGLSAMFLILYTRNNVSILYFFTIHARGVAEWAAWQFVCFYIVSDIFFYVRDMSLGLQSGVGYVAHLSGYGAGIVFGIVLIMTDRIVPTRDEQPLPELLGWKKY